MNITGPVNEVKSKIFCISYQVLNGRKYFHLSLCFLFTILLLLGSCKKEQSSSEIPNVTVNLALPLALPEYSPLSTVGNSIEISGGYKGILVYHRFQNEFVAFEKACPYDPLESAAIVILDSNNVIGVDLNCGSKFFLTDGSILNGPATQSLKQYQTDYDAGSQTLYIFN